MAGRHIWALFLTRACNMACAYCYLRDLPAVGDAGGVEMPRGTLLRALDFIGAHSVGAGAASTDVGMFGREPLMAPELVRLVLDEAPRRVPRATLSINTNAALLDGAMLDAFERSGVRTAISLDGDPESHDSGRKPAGGGGAYARIKDNLPRLAAYSPAVIVRMTVTPATAGRIRQNVAHIAGLGFRQISLAFDLTSPGWDHAAVEEARGSLDALSDWYVMQVASGAAVTIPAFDSLAAGRTVPPHGLFCGAASTLFSVDPDGAIHPCWRFAGDAAWRMGDVFSGFSADPATHRFNRISQRETPGCADCPHTGYCGRCAWLGLRLAGDPAAVSKLQCRMALMVMEAGRKACDALISSGCGAFIARLPVLDAAGGGDGAMVITDRRGSVYNMPALELERFRVR